MPDSTVPDSTVPPPPPPPPPPAGSTLVRGARLHHEQRGTGPDLVWGHGLTMDRAADDVTATLDWSAVPARVLRYDARGHGASTTTHDDTEYGWDSLAEDQLALCDALGIERYIGGGASMGCATAVHVAVKAPDRVTGLVLMIPPTAWETRAAQADLYRAGAEIVRTQGVEPMIRTRRSLPPPDPFAGDEGHQDQRDELLRAWDTDRLAQALRGAATADLPPRPAIAGLDVPTLILAWTGDPVHPVSTAEELHGLIGGSELVIASSRTELDGWTALVADFVGRVAGPSAGESGRTRGR